MFSYYTFQNRCQICEIDLGQCNPRQLCGKTYCENDGMKFTYDPEWKDFFDEHGWVVIEDVVEAQECRTKSTAIRTYCESVSNTDMDHCISKTIELRWQLQSEKKIQTIFETISKRKKMVPMRSCCTISLIEKGALLQHAVIRNEFKGLSQMTSCMAVEGDITCTILHGSRQLYNAFTNHFKIEKKRQKNAFKLEKKHLHWFMKNGAVQRDIKAKKGSLVLCDSKTFHTECSTAHECSNVNVYISFK